MPNKIRDRTEGAIQEKVFPGCVIGFVERGKQRIVLPFGTLMYQSTQEVCEDTIYDLASITKSIPTASLALMLIAEGRLSPSDKVVAHLPELQNDYGATVQDLLMYRVAGTRFSTLKDRTPEEISTYVFEHGFNGPPAERLYTNLPAFLLGLIIERVAGKTLDVLAQEYFFDPLEMRSTIFFPNVRPTRSNIAPTETVNGKEVRGIVHDESARVFSLRRRAVGHAGLFSTAPDILNFLEALLRGKLPGVADGARKHWGWQKAEPWFMGERFGEGAFGKTGFTGTSVGVDPSHETAFVILSNRTYPVRPPDAASIHSAVNIFRADIADIVLR